MFFLLCYIQARLRDAFRCFGRSPLFITNSCHRFVYTFSARSLSLWIMHSEKSILEFMLCGPFHEISLPGPSSCLEGKFLICRWCRPSSLPNASQATYSSFQQCFFADAFSKLDDSKSLDIQLKIIPDISDHPSFTVENVVPLPNARHRQRRVHKWHRISAQCVIRGTLVLLFGCFSTQRSRVLPIIYRPGMAWYSSLLPCNFLIGSRTISLILSGLPLPLLRPDPTVH